MSFAWWRLMVVAVALLARTAAATVVEQIGSVVGDPGSTVGVDVTLDSAGAAVAVAQLDIDWDASTPLATTPGGAPACTVNPAIHKDDSVFAFEPFGCTPGVDCTSVRALIFSLTDVSPIPGGSVLMTCSFHVSASAPGGPHLLGGTTCVTADANGIALDTACGDGSVGVAIASPMTGRSLVMSAATAGFGFGKLAFSSKDPSLHPPRGGEDPRCFPVGAGQPSAGARLHVVGAHTDFTLDLPCVNWTANDVGTRFFYSDLSGTTCHKISLKAHSLRLKCKGMQIVSGIGTPLGDVAVTLTTGAPPAGRRYCAAFGPSTNAKVIADGSDGRHYVARSATAPASCPP